MRESMQVEFVQLAHAAAMLCPTLPQNNPSHTFHTCFPLSSAKHHLRCRHVTRLRHHMNLATDPSAQVNGRMVNMYSVAALMAAKMQREAAAWAVLGRGRCRAASRRGSVKYLQGNGQHGEGKWLVCSVECMFTTMHTCACRRVRTRTSEANGGGVVMLPGRLMATYGTPFGNLGSLDTL